MRWVGALIHHLGYQTAVRTFALYRRGDDDARPAVHDASRLAAVVRGDAGGILVAGLDGACGVQVADTSFNKISEGGACRLGCMVMHGQRVTFTVEFSTVLVGAGAHHDLKVTKVDVGRHLGVETRLAVVHSLRKSLPVADRGDGHFLCTGIAA